MTKRKLSLLLASSLAIGAATLAISQTAAAGRAVSKGTLKEKPPVTQVCDPAAYQICLAGGVPGVPPTVAACKAFSDCGKEVN